MYCVNEEPHDLLGSAGTDGKRYADDSAYDNHLRQAPIQELRAWLPGGLGEPPQIWELDVQEDSTFTRLEVVGYENPVIVFTELGYKQGALQSTLPYWKEVADVSKAESGTLVWGVSLDREDPDKLAVIHVYESTQYLMHVHAASKEMQAVQEFTANIRTHIAPHFLEFVGGYIWK
jgi:quinol monooxygenase YgiN